jgi:hypothetical protein
VGGGLKADGKRSLSSMFLAVPGKKDLLTIITNAGGKWETVAEDLAATALAVDARNHVWVLVQDKPHGNPMHLSFHEYVQPATPKLTWDPVLPVHDFDLSKSTLAVPDIKGMLADSRNFLYLTDAGNGLIWRMNPETGQLQTVAGDPQSQAPLRELELPAASLPALGALGLTREGDIAFLSGNALVQLTAPSAPGEAWVDPPAWTPREFKSRAGAKGPAPKGPKPKTPEELREEFLAGLRDAQNRRNKAATP